MAETILLLAFINAVFLFSLLSRFWPPWLVITAMVPLFWFYLSYLIMPVFHKKSVTRLDVLYSGCLLLTRGAWCSLLQIILLSLMAFRLKPDKLVLIINTIVSAVSLFLILADGILRICATARQIKISRYVFLILFWWVPVVNLFVFCSLYKAARHEYRFETAKLEQNLVRKENESCKTRYPVVLVHGIFFRDWHLLNYWGRISGELMKNGAVIFYGHQQSSESVEKSAAELKEQILKIIADTGCEKVNIIAHSKGGLDARYLISCLGMESCVASLTTINTPHRGCKFIDVALRRVPDSLLRSIARKYNRLYTIVGDTKPDFYHGFLDLTAANCTAFNQNVSDMEGVYYQSYMSQMNHFFSAGFPQNFGYLMNKHYSGKNDGLVTVESAKWGDSFQLVTVKGRRGISHGDMIDLLRENIKGFDVREFYVKLFSDLKAKGF